MNQSRFYLKIFRVQKKVFWKNCLGREVVTLLELLALSWSEFVLCQECMGKLSTSLHASMAVLGRSCPWQILSLAGLVLATLRNSQEHTLGEEPWGWDWDVYMTVMHCWFHFCLLYHSLPGFYENTLHGYAINYLHLLCLHQVCLTFCIVCLFVVSCHGMLLYSFIWYQKVTVQYRWCFIV